MKKIIIIIFLGLMCTQVFAAEGTDAELFDDIEALLDESDSDVKDREAAEQRAKAELDSKYRGLINNFKFPQDRCKIPKLSIPTTNDGFRRLARRLNTWQDCEARMDSADYSHLRQLILDLDGEWHVRGQQIDWDLGGNKSVTPKEIEALWEKLYRRSEDREQGLEILHTFFTEHVDEYYAEVERQNREIDRQNRSNFWLDALKGMEQGLREHNQRNYQQY